MDGWMDEIAYTYRIEIEQNKQINQINEHIEFQFRFLMMSIFFLFQEFNCIHA